MIRLRLTEDHGSRKAGEGRDYDEVSARNLIESGAAVLASQPAEVFDPAAHTVEQVLAHIAGADEAEVTRVRAVEAAGKDRAGLRESAAT